MFRAGGFSVDLTHHVMHAMGSRMLGFTQELFNDSPTTVDPEAQARCSREMARTYPAHRRDGRRGGPRRRSVVGSGCDDQFEFEFALDLLLDGFERLQQQGWTSTIQPGGVVWIDTGQPEGAATVRDT